MKFMDWLKCKENPILFLNVFVVSMHVSLWLLECYIYDKLVQVIDSWDNLLKFYRRHEAKIHLELSRILVLYVNFFTLCKFIRWVMCLLSEILFSKNLRSSVTSQAIK